MTNMKFIKKTPAGMIKRFAIVTATLMAFSLPAMGQMFQGSWNMALGGGGVTYVSDYDALFVNPANLMLRDKKNTFVIGFGNVNASGGGPLANINAYNQYFTKGDTLSI